MVDNRRSAADSAADQVADFSAGTGYMPVRTSATSGAEMPAVHAERPQFGTAVDQLETTRVQDRARAFVPSGDQYPTTAMERIMLQNAPPAAAFSAAAAETTASYEQNVARYL
jgi:sn-glycerol 3-phosphate transport system substrate-binding protein